MTFNHQFINQNNNNFNGFQVESDCVREKIKKELHLYRNQGLSMGQLELIKRNEERKINKG